MRITTRMMTTRYTSSLNNLSSGLNQLNYQISSGRSFTKASENTSAAISAFQLRRDLSKAEGYQNNISFAQDTLSNAESSLMNINEMMQTAGDRILQGMNGTLDSGDKAIVARDLRAIQGQLFQSLNATSAGNYIFGGTETEAKPFSLNTAGSLLYKGINLDDITNEALLPGKADIESKLKKDSLFIDIGLNLKFDPAETNALDSSTAFNLAIPGINFTGSGMTSLNGYSRASEAPNNLYSLIGAIATEFESANYSRDNVDALYEHFQARVEDVGMTVSEIGSKTSYLEFMSNRLDSESANMLKRQTEVEYADPAKTIIDFKSQEMAYNAALQMGAKIIQPSIFDFMR